MIRQTGGVALAFLMLSPLCYSQTVTIDQGTQRYLGSVSELDRGKYFVLHGIRSDADLDSFYNQYNVAKGRYFWGPFSYAESETGAFGKYPPYKNGPRGVRPVQKGLVSTEHPRSAIRYNSDLAAAADWTAEYFKDFLTDDGPPEFFEPMNEPFVHAGDDVFKDQQPDTELMRRKMADLFAEVGRKVDQTPELANMKVIGYSSAWPSLELRDFWHWNTFQKMFMDRAGAHMDGFSTHLYDGINVTGQDSLRSGSNSEAILDMIETYSFIKWGTVKPHAITEYGGIEKGFGENYSDLANAQALRSLNHLIFNFLERQNDLLISIPFITGKSTWHLTAANKFQPYGAVLFRPKNIGTSNPGEWVYTPRLHFYDLWRKFKGKRVETNSDNPDIQAQAFADNNKLYVALNNIDNVTRKVNLNFVDDFSGFQNVRIKTLKVFADRLPAFSNVVRTAAPSTISMISGETVTLEYTFANEITFDNTLTSSKYYTDSYLNEIKAGVTQAYRFDTVDTGSGKATLRLSIGRKHNRSKSPVVRVNGTRVAVPENWTGYDQVTRTDFFGTIKIPFSISLLTANNEVTVEFPDNGGHVASLILQVEKYEQDLGDPENIPPEVSFTQPVDGQELDSGASLSAIAMATDSDGTVANVRLYLNDTLVRQEDVSPYRWGDNGQDPALQNLAPGSYVLKAIATDDAGGTGEATVTIRVRLNAPIKIDLKSIRVSEDAGQANVVAKLSRAASNDLSIGVHTIPNSADSGEDFYGFSNVFTIPANSMTVDIPVVILDDTKIEQDESFNVRIYEATGASIGESANVTISDNDDGSGAPTLSLIDLSVSEGETAKLNVTMSKASSAPVTFQFATSHGEALNQEDYYGTWQELTLKPGQTRITVDIQTVDDAVVEPEETFTGRVFRAVGASVTKSKATVVILDDD